MCQRVGGDSMDESVVCIVRVFDFVRCSQWSDCRGSVVSAMYPNRKRSSLSPERAGHSHDGYQDIYLFIYLIISLKLTNVQKYSIYIQYNIYIYISLFIYLYIYCGLLVNSQSWERWNAQLDYVNCQQGWEYYQMLGGCQLHVAKFFEGLLEFALIRWRTQQLYVTRWLRQ